MGRPIFLFIIFAILFFGVETKPKKSAKRKQNKGEIMKEVDDLIAEAAGRKKDDEDESVPDFEKIEKKHNSRFNGKHKKKSSNDQEDEEESQPEEWEDDEEQDNSEYKDTESEDSEEDDGDSEDDSENDETKHKKKHHSVSKPKKKHHHVHGNDDKGDKKKSKKPTHNEQSLAPNGIAQSNSLDGHKGDFTGLTGLNVGLSYGLQKLIQGIL